MVNWKRVFLGTFYIIEMAREKENLFSLEGKLCFSGVFHKIFLCQWLLIY